MEPKQAGAGLRGIIRHPAFLGFAPLYATCSGAVFAVQGVWAGRWLADVNGWSRDDVTSALAGMAGVLIVAAPCWGILTRWLRRRRALPGAAWVAAALLILVEAAIIAGTPVPPMLPWCLFAAFGGITVLSFSVVAEHFPPTVIGRANGALNVAQIGCSFVVQLGIGQIVARWPSVAGHYPAEAYRAGLLLPLGLQAAALAWFAWRSVLARGTADPSATLAAEGA